MAGKKKIVFGTWSNRLEMFQFGKITILESGHFSDPFRPIFHALIPKMMETTRKMLQFQTYPIKLEIIHFEKITILENVHFFDPFRPFSTRRLEN